MRHLKRLFFLVVATLFISPPVYATHFTDMTGRAGVGDLGTGRGSSFNDYDGDGDLDILVVNGGRNILYRNDGKKGFTNMTESAGIGDKGYEFGAAFGDYDNDGDLDLYIVNGGFIADMLGKTGKKKLTITAMDSEGRKSSEGVFIPQRGLLLSVDGERNSLYSDKEDGDDPVIAKRRYMKIFGLL